MGAWAQRHWAGWSVLAAVMGGVHALGIFRDWRAGVLAAVASGTVNALAWRPGGFGHRIGQREQAREAAGEPMARPGCVVAMAVVAVVVIASALVGAQIWG